MPTNLGSLDRALRFSLGVVILACGIFFRTPWGLLGLALVGTAALRFCPAYLPFGLSTCAREKGKR